MIDIVLRYYPLVKYIKKVQPQKILEIGSDDYGISPFLDQNITLLDTNFRRQRMKNVTYKKGSVLDLPFKKNEFDCVISVDMLEHLPPSLRKKAIQEMLRVSGQYLLIAFPADNPAQKRDQRFFKILGPLSSSATFHYIKEHIKNGLPNSEKTIKFIHSKANVSIQSEKNINANLDLFLVIFSNLEFFPILLLQKILDPFKIDVLPVFFRFFLVFFGFLAPILSYGDCYRTILLIKKNNQHIPL